MKYFQKGYIGCTIKVWKLCRKRSIVSVHWRLNFCRLRDLAWRSTHGALVTNLKGIIGDWVMDCAQRTGCDNLESTAHVFGIIPLFQVCGSGFKLDRTCNRRPFMIINCCWMCGQPNSHKCKREPVPCLLQCISPISKGSKFTSTWAMLRVSMKQVTRLHELLQQLQK